jgi:hypothetical protein
MHSTLQEFSTTMPDGDVDPGIEQRDTSAGRGNDVGTEAAAHAMLRLVGEHPGQMGRLRAARLIGGYPVPHRDAEEAASLTAYAVELTWPLREITRLVDVLIEGRLMAQTPGPRPVLVLTRAGFRALEALEGGSGTGFDGP